MDELWATYVIPGMAQICLLLLPEEKYMELLRQWRKLIRDVLQRFGALLQGVEELAIGIRDLLGGNGAEHASGCACELCFVTSVVRSSEEQDCVGGDKDGVEVSDVLGGSAGRVR